MFSSNTISLNPDDFGPQIAALNTQQECLESEAKRLGTDSSKLASRFKNLRLRREVSIKLYTLLRKADEKKGEKHDVQATLEYLLKQKEFLEGEKLLLLEINRKLDEKFDAAKNLMDTNQKAERNRLLDISKEVQTKTEELWRMIPGLKEVMQERLTFFSSKYYDLFVKMISKRDGSELTPLFLKKLFNAVVALLKWHVEGKVLFETQKLMIKNEEVLEKISAINNALYAHAETFQASVDAYCKAEAGIVALEKSDLGHKRTQFKNELAVCEERLRMIQAYDIPFTLAEMQEAKLAKAAEKSTSSRAAQAASNAAALAGTTPEDTFTDTFLGWAWATAQQAFAPPAIDEASEQRGPRGRHIPSYGSTK